MKDYREILHSRETIIADHWYEAIAPLVPGLNVAEAWRYLAEQARQVINLLAEPFEREKAEAIGEALARDISPEAPMLGATQEVLARQLVEGLPAEEIMALYPLIVELLSGLATGFVRENTRYVKTLRRRFLSTTSHDMRALLSAIIGFSRVILKGIDGPLTDLQKQDLTAIYEGGQKLLNLINDVFNIEKVEAGVLDVKAEDLDLTALVSAVTVEVRPLVDEYGNTLEVHYQNAPMGMHSDPSLLKPVLVNLLGNAARFTRKGRVTLTISGDVVDGTEWVIFQVTDTGLGMTPEQVRRFIEGGAPTALNYTDIGLMVGQRYCRLLGGEMTVESEVGKGTTFTVRLPVRSPAVGR